MRYKVGDTVKIVSSVLAHRMGQIGKVIAANYQIDLAYIVDLNGQEVCFMENELELVQSYTYGKYKELAKGLQGAKDTKEKLTVAIKHDDGKLPFELIPVAALTEIVKVLQFGKKKYDADNWRSHGGFGWRRLAGALLRHTFAWLGGEDKDPETGFSHMAHAGCCVFFLLEHVLVPGLGKDDRWKYAVTAEERDAG